jgi:hypothetical protein
MISQLKIFLILLCFSLLMTSCNNPFHPKLRNNGHKPSNNDTPQAVLQALEQAYKQKNIKMFEGCLAPDFRFELLSSEVNIIGIDWNNDGLKDSWWGYEQEVEYHTNLFLEGSTDGSYPPPDQINLRLQIPPQQQWESDPQVGHETWVVIPCLFDLQLIYSASSSTLTSNGVARFYLKPIDNRWYIAIWRDESNI